MNYYAILKLKNKKWRLISNKMRIENNITNLNKEEINNIFQRIKARRKRCNRRFI